MANKKQHFVPRAYVKAWNTEESLKNVYKFEGNEIGIRQNIDTILWIPHLYTVNFRCSYICKKCPKIKKDFVSMIHDKLLNTYKQPVYAKIGYSNIKTKHSIAKHFFELKECDFYYDNGKLAPKSSIIKAIEDLNCYMIEKSFDDFFEKKWEKIYLEFIDAVHNGLPIAYGRSEKIIPMDVAQNMLSSFFIMLCRNPKFDAMGIYSDIKKNVLYPIFMDEYSENEENSISNLDESAQGYVKELMDAVWYTELYKIFFKTKGGFYHTAIDMALKGLQMILFEAYDGEGYFVTSDNPAFEYKMTVEKRNSAGMIFPISPKYLIFIAKGDEGINVVDHRYAKRDDIHRFNKIIAQYKNKTIISNIDRLDKLM